MPRLCRLAGLYDCGFVDEDSALGLYRLCIPACTQRWAARGCCVLCFREPGVLYFYPQKRALRVYGLWFVTNQARIGSWCVF